MTELEKKIFDTFGITVDEIDSAEGRKALGGFYDRVVAALQTQDEEAIDFIINEIAVVKQDTGAEGLVEENEVVNIVDESIQKAFQEVGFDLGALTGERVFYSYNSETGSLDQLTLPSIFPKGFTALYNETISPELIGGLQNDLVRNGVVASDYFDDEDQFGQKTEQVLSILMEYADKNFKINIDSEEGIALIQQYKDGQYGFLENESDEIIFARAMLDQAVQGVGRDVRKQEELQKKLEDEQTLQVLAARYTIPTFDEMEDTLNEVVNQIVPRDATQKELNRYSTSLAEKYSDRFKQLVALEKAVRANNIFEQVPAIEGLPDDMLVTPTKQALRTDIFQITDPEAAVSRQIKQDLEKEVSVIEQANAARKQQASLIEAMLGQI
tara:strand:- start:8998 stop:10149 length:1152 start_codon:yes stop_codon:yes gene_type:complete